MESSALTANWTSATEGVESKVGSKVRLYFRPVWREQYLTGCWLVFDAYDAEFYLIRNRVRNSVDSCVQLMLSTATHALNFGVGTIKNGVSGESGW